MNVTVRMKDGTSYFFKQEYRPGGSYTNSVRSDGPFLVVVDVWGKETWIPSADVRDVVTEPTGGRI